MEPKKGIIYEIRCNKTGEVYYGSTFKKLNRRMGKHKTGQNNCSSKKIINRGDFTAKILFECEVSNKTELRKLESIFIRNNDCVNQVDSYRSAEERQKYQKNYYKKYYKNLETVNCECGGRYKNCSGDRNKHFKTKIHGLYIEAANRDSSDD
jgi:hypothetical protein